MAVWIPVTVVCTSFATDWMDTFMTELSSVMRNWADARISRTGDRRGAFPVDVGGVFWSPGDVTGRS